MISFLDEFVEGDLATLMIRLLSALVLSGLIGFERELKNQSAGFRTHILVGVGACLMMLLSIYGFDRFIGADGNIRFDPARIPSYVISGIGFLGAGTIIVHGSTIRGLTTAASIWTVAGLGLVVGAGMYFAAVFTTLIILLSLIFLNKFEKRFQRHYSYLIEIAALPGLQINHVVSIFESYSLTIKHVEIERISDDVRHIVVKIESEKQYMEQLALFEEISKLAYVKSISERR
ncbi:hypothetical protein GCM10028778_18960 [Barrientosiimonas marina]|uniref:MgtC/SapB family protein n=1 Tax=Lentibacillus kimchii TaxID=1542911 RepID=A0ABW2UWZ5_9BACI